MTVNTLLHAATNLHPPPNDIQLVEAQAKQLIFNWTPALSTCSIVQYNITSNCGTCPAVTNMTRAACSDFQLTTNAVLCQFSVNSVACNHPGNSSSPITVILKGNSSNSFKYYWLN